MSSSATFSMYRVDFPTATGPMFFPFSSDDVKLLVYVVVRYPTLSKISV